MGKNILLLIIYFLSLGVQAQRNLVEYVNTLQGTDSHFGLSYGNTYATTAMPYAMHTWSAQTGKNGEGWKYQYSVDNIRGFQQAHQCSPWVSDYAVYSLMPVMGDLVVNQDQRATKFSHDNETAKPHYYSVLLDNGITTEMAPTMRGVHLRFSWPEKGGDVYLVLDGYTDKSEIFINPSKNEIRGWVNNQRFVNNSENFRNYFVIHFDNPFQEYGIWENRTDSIFPGEKSGNGKGYGAFIKFKSGATVQAKAASSYISYDQACLTLERELGKDKSLEVTKKRGAKTWNELLNRVLVEGGTDEQIRTFYSCLYRANLFSRKFYERDENNEPYYYSPYDGKIYKGYMYTDNEIRQSDNFTKRTVFSGWDVFRAQFPLQTLINPSLVNDMIRSLVTLADESGKGYFERWELLNAYSACMIGNPAISVLTDAFFKGINDYDIDEAYQVALNTSERSGNEVLGFSVRSDAPDSGSAGYAVGEFSISNTLELSYTEWCMSQLAKKLSLQEDYEKYLTLSKSYKNVFDPRIGWFRAKNEDGTWKEWPERGRFQDGYGTVESNPYQQGWFVPHDVEGMVELMGGRERVIADLLEFFENVPDDMMWNDYYNHANEPVHHVPFLFNRLGYPWLTQKWSRDICRRAYNNSVNGLVGNDDVGQMSAWYVLASIGLYQVCPGDLRFEISSPVFDEITIRLDDKYASGNSFTIKAIHNSVENIYVQSATLNGEPLQRCYLNYEEIISGGILEVVMGPNPNQNWGI